MSKKKGLALLLAMILSFSALAACGGDDNDNNHAGNNSNTEQPDNGNIDNGNIDDGSSDDGNVDDGFIEDGEDEEIPVVDAYDVMNLGEIAVGIYATPPTPTQEHYSWMAQAGINFVNGFRWSETSVDEIREAMTYADNEDMKFLVNDGVVYDLLDDHFKLDPKSADYEIQSKALVNQAMEQIALYSDHSAYAGQFFIDEPFNYQLDDIAAFSNAFDEEYEGYFWNVNMFPTQIAAGTLGANYTDFMDNYFNLTNAKSYSFDCYPMLIDGIMSDYIYCLDLVRTKTVERGVPFWNFIQVMGIGDTKIGLQKRDPSDEDIRWQVFMSLAFGAKGIQYFTYATPDSTDEVFTAGMIDKDGNRSPHYYAVQEVNEDFKDYSEILVHCDSKGVIYNGLEATGNYTLYSSNSLLNSYGALQAISGDAAIIGCFEHTATNKQYIMIVPPSPETGARMELSFDDSLDTITTYMNCATEEVELEDGKVTLTIARGDAIFIEI